MVAILTTYEDVEDINDVVEDVRCILLQASVDFKLEDYKKILKRVEKMVHKISVDVAPLTEETNYE